MSVSVVMLSFNQLDFLPRAIDSVLDQESVDLQLIIVDPGSTDGSREFIRKIAKEDNRVIFIFEPDGGPADGLNKGFRRAEHEFVGYLNSDDVYFPSTLKVIEKSFNLDAAVDTIYAHGIILDERFKRKSQFAYSDHFSKFSISIGTARIMQQSTFFRRQSLEKSGITFNTENSTCWDYEFLVDAFIAGMSFLRIEEVLGVFRIHSKSITGSKINSQIYELDKNRIIEKFDYHFGAYPTSLHFWLSISYRMLRRIKLLFLKIKFQHKVKGFSKRENIGFMD